MVNYIGKICPLCKAEIKEGEAVRVCPSCGVFHHEACWVRNNGCTTVGCAENHQAQVAAPAAVCGNCGVALGAGQQFCSNCGQNTAPVAVPATAPVVAAPVAANAGALLHKLSERVKTNGIIWLVIGILQIVAGLFIDWVFLIVGVLNIISSIQDMNYSKTVLENPTGIVARFEPLVGPIITLIYNLVIGGVIGVAGSIYYFVAIRSFVMENRVSFAQYDAQTL